MASSAPITPPNEPIFHEITMDDLAVLDAITSPSFNTKQAKFRRRDAHFDPLIFAAAVCSGPQITRHHYFHRVYPHEPENHRHHNCDTCSFEIDVNGHDGDVRPMLDVPSENDSGLLGQQSTSLGQSASLGDVAHGDDCDCALTVSSNDEGYSSSSSNDGEVSPKYQRFSEPSPQISPVPTLLSSISSFTSSPRSRPPLQIQCQARTRVPTPHGQVFLHLYHNNWDSKEHLAVVVDPVQLEEENPDSVPIRSLSLDSKWSEDESDMDRITRGAYVGRLSSSSSKPSSSSTPHNPQSQSANDLAPLVRIHSECFTGETIGSLRCDCGEQLDEAIRLISQTPTRKGAVIYLRQEGRGIGLLEKIRAYNLQDLGHDTVTANLMLGHKADERGYEIAAAIMKDLGLGNGVRLLTNNPDKIEQLSNQGIRIVERVEMVPRSWKCGNNDVRNVGDGDDDDAWRRRKGATLIGGSITRSVELEAYLKTKVQKMGHMLDLPSSNDRTAVNTPISDELVISL